MRVEFHTKGFDKTPSVETFINNAAGDLINEFLRNDGDVHLKINVDEDRHRNQSRKPHFFCEIQLKTASSKKYFKAHKTAEDFHTAVHGAVHAMKTILQRRSDRRHDLKVVDSTVTVPATTATSDDEFQTFDEANS